MYVIGAQASKPCMLNTHSASKWQAIATSCKEPIAHRMSDLGQGVQIDSTMFCISLRMVDRDLFTTSLAYFKNSLKDLSILQVECSRVSQISIISCCSHNRPGEVDHYDCKSTTARGQRSLYYCNDSLS